MAAKTASKPNGATVLSGILRELASAELARVETALRHGPKGTGWRYNEAKRPGLEARKALLLEALI